MYILLYYNIIQADPLHKNHVLNRPKNLSGKRNYS